MSDNGDGISGLEFYLLPNGTYGVKAGTTKYMEKIVIPSTHNGKSVTVIMENGFESMRNLKEIIMPESLTTIEDYAFNDCKALIKADIPSSVVSIGAYAFNNCSNLQEIALPKNITTIKEYSFYGCSSVSNKIIIPDSVSIIEPHALEISSEKEIYFEKESSWNVTSDKAYYQQNSYLYTSENNYYTDFNGPKIFTVSVDSTTNYAEDFFYKRLSFSVRNVGTARFLATNECTWTKK